MSQAVPVLMYHHVSPNPGLVTVSPETFARQMEHVHRAGFTTLSADRFLAFLEGQAEVPRKSVLITFDDGFLDNYVHAYPVLRQYGLRATVFAVTGWVGDGPVRARAGQGEATKLPATPDHRSCMAAIRDGRGDDVMLRWSEVQQMETEGVVEVHSHTHRHVRWDERCADRAEQLAGLKADLEQSRSALRQRLAKESSHLCWPWGRFEPDDQSLANDLGFRAQYTTFKGVNVCGTNPASVARVVVKDRPGRWFASRLWIYRHAWVGRFYCLLRGDARADQRRRARPPRVP
jgi:peptidoglycan/xylan/chitin deacetylase (PgdA/CDA1 family)